MSLPELYRAEKAIAFFPGWSDPEPETGFMWFHAPLEIEGVVLNDFVLKGGCLCNAPGKNVSFELRSGAPGLKRKIPLSRIDWLSIRGGHSNKRGPDLPWAGKRVGASHIHQFELNWVQAEDRMRKGNLPQAEPFSQPIQSFDSLLQMAGKLFRISNIDIVGTPEWEYGLFNNG